MDSFHLGDYRSFDWRKGEHEIADVAEFAKMENCMKNLLWIYVFVLVVYYIELSYSVNEHRLLKSQINFKNGPKIWFTVLSGLKITAGQRTMFERTSWLVTLYLVKFGQNPLHISGKNDFII